MVVRVDASRNIANAFSISYNGHDPRKTQLVAAAIASGYVDAQATSTTNSSVNTKEFFDQQIVETKSKLDEIDQRRLQFMLQNIGNLPSENGALIGRLTALYEQQKAYIGEIGRLRDQRTVHDSQLNDIKEQSERARLDASDVVGDPKSNSAYVQFAATKARLEAELKGMLTQMTPQNPDVKMKQSEIESVQQQMDQIIVEGKAKVAERQERIMKTPDLRINGIEASLKLMDGNLGRLERQLEDTNKQIAEIETRINRVPGAQVALEGLDREYQTQKTLYDDLLGRSSRANLGAAVASNAQGETIQVIEPANYPETPIAPKRFMLMGLGVAAGLAIGLFLAAIFEVPNMLSIQGRNDAEHYTNLPLLVSIPLLLTPEEVQRRRLRRIMLSTAAAVATVVSIPLLIMLLKISDVFARFGA
ncbi:MAG: GNVR domain-containing protein [Pyrinomonadaceae bacterium]